MLDVCARMRSVLVVNIYPPPQPPSKMLFTSSVDCFVYYSQLCDRVKEIPYTCM